MPAYLETFNQILAYGAIFLQVVAFVLVISLIFSPRTNSIRVFFKEYTFIFSFILAFSAVCLSLFYSNIIGFPPCELCWISRITMYPLALLMGMELYKKDKSIVDHAIVLALLNVITSIYHVYIEHGGNSALPCADPNITTQVSCATRYVYEFGYITMPMMALTVSFFILMLLINYKHSTR
jgi:disulfide bond formation protein DsbB